MDQETGKESGRTDPWICGQGVLLHMREEKTGVYSIVSRLHMAHAGCISRLKEWQRT